MSRRRRPVVTAAAGGAKIKLEMVANLQAELLRRIRARDGLSRTDLARDMGLAPSTVGIYVDRLVDQGFLRESKSGERDSGRPPTLLSPNAQGGRFIGVDFEARNLFAVAVDFSQNPLRRFHDILAPGESVPNILRQIERAVETVAAGDQRPILGLGVGVPGVIDHAQGVALRYKHIPGWANVPLVRHLSDRFGVPVYLENNIRTMALAELWFGQGRAVSNFICLGVRSGVGAGIIVNGQIYRGANNRAGEIGEWPSFAPGWKAVAGDRNIARLEELASFRSVGPRLAHAGSGAPASLRVPGAETQLEVLLQAARTGDAEVLGILDRTAGAFGLALNQLQCAFDPEKIILAGLFTAFGDLFRSRLEAKLQAFAPTIGGPVVVNSELGDYNGALGAAALGVHAWRPALS